jgi:hypothetical protein
MKIKCHPKIHSLEKEKNSFFKWNQHEEKVWQIGKPVQLVSDLFCGQLIGFTRKEQIHSPKVMKHYPSNKKTIIRIAGTFLRSVKIRDLWLTGIFEERPGYLPPWPILPCGRKAAQIKSPHLVLEPDNERIAHTSTPLFPMMDALTVLSMEGKTMEEIFSEVDLTNEPIQENWVTPLQFSLPSKEFQKDPSGLTYRKSINFMKRISDWPLIRFGPGNLIVMEFVNDSVCPIDLIASWTFAWDFLFQKEWKVYLEDWIPIIPFGAFECGENLIQKCGGDKWQCKKHLNKGYTPAELRCCFPPIPTQEKEHFLWFLELSRFGK